MTSFHFETICTEFRKSKMKMVIKLALISIWHVQKEEEIVK